MYGARLAFRLLNPRRPIGDPAVRLCEARSGPLPRTRPQSDLHGRQRGRRGLGPGTGRLPLSFSVEGPYALGHVAWYQTVGDGILERLMERSVDVLDRA